MNSGRGEATIHPYWLFGKEVYQISPILPKSSITGVCGVLQEYYRKPPDSLCGSFIFPELMLAKDGRNFDIL
jgi:hypothetical protein